MPGLTYEAGDGTYFALSMGRLAWTECYASGLADAHELGDQLLGEVEPLASACDPAFRAP